MREYLVFLKGVFYSVVLIIGILVVVCLFCLALADKQIEYYYISGGQYGLFVVQARIPWSFDNIVRRFSTWQEAIELCNALNDTLQKEGQ